MLTVTSAKQNCSRSLTATPSVLASNGNITLRATDFEMKTVRALAKASDVLVALDAAGAIDARTRGTGELVLGRALAWFRERRG